MGVESIFLASVLLAIPISARYVTAFQIRTLQDRMRRREKNLALMFAQLKGLRQEELITRRAANQVQGQHKWADTRRDVMAMELARVRRPVVAVVPAFEPELPPEWTPDGLREQTPYDADGVAASATAAEAAA